MIDTHDNIFLVGTTNGDAWVSKHNSVTGAVLWRTFISTTASDGATNHTMSTDGTAVYVSGYTEGAFPGYSWAGSEDAFLAKVSAADGTILWVHQFGTSATDRLNGVTDDGAGNVFGVGQTNGAFAGFTNQGAVDGFIAKFDADGNQLWLHQFGGADDDIIGGPVFDKKSGALVTCGLTWSTFATGRNKSYDWNPVDGIMVSHSTQDGSVVWIRTFGGVGPDDGDGGCVIGSDGTIYIHGGGFLDYGGTLPAYGTGGWKETYMVAYALDGTLKWSREYKTTHYDFAGGICMDNAGRIFVSMHTWGSFPGSSGGCVVIFEVDSSGDVKELRQFGSTGCREVNDWESQQTVGQCKVDSANAVYVTGIVQHQRFLAKWTTPYVSCTGNAAPANGALGDCASDGSLAHGASCQPTCSTGYTVSGATSCSAGTLTAATCTPNNCTGNAAPANGALGDCAGDGSLAHSASCQPTCSTGYAVSGATSCSAGTLTSATCAHYTRGYNVTHVKVSKGGHFSCATRTLPSAATFRPNASIPTMTQLVCWGDNTYGQARNSIEAD